MASYKNLERIHEIAESLPKLEDARKLLADFGNEVEVIVHKPKRRSQGAPYKERASSCRRT